ncbi:YsnF/AvaK domain-containing protein [uncultured Hymenobacter sp.]|uniref:YsnF/AvaK domain-containing protein n=1 Tax=uncultured Hymenobacter sp. TaxID=170016 RepID=UPI0035C98AEC
MSASAPQSQPTTAAAASPADTTAASGAVVLPVIEEQAVINRELVEAGRVRITRQVHEADELVRVAVQHDEVRVERVAVNQYLPAGAPTPPTRYEGEVMIIPVLREVAVVEKRLLLVEELRVTKQQVMTEHAESVRLRREEINVERLPGASLPAAGPAPQ